MEDLQRFLINVVEPTIEEFQTNPHSVRHAFLACVAAFHCVYYLAYPDKPSALRGELSKRSAAFRTIDDVAHAFKHVATGKGENPRLKADQVVFDSKFNHVGGVTLSTQQGVDLLKDVREAVQFVRRKGQGISFELRRRREAKRNAPPVAQSHPRPLQE
jgi:hypothetical protein